MEVALPFSAPSNFSLTGVPGSRGQVAGAYAGVTSPGTPLRGNARILGDEPALLEAADGGDGDSAILGVVRPPTQKVMIQDGRREGKRRKCVATECS